MRSSLYEDWRRILRVIGICGLSLETCFSWVGKHSGHCHNLCRELLLLFNYFELLKL
jgi:hypothetical protein